MAEITLRGIVDAIAALSLAGVRTVYAEPPSNVTTDELPALWPELPTLDSGDFVFSCDTLNTTATMQFVIAVSPYGQKTQPIRFNDSVDIVDQLRTVLSTTSHGGTWSYSTFLYFELSVGTDINTMTAFYWGIRATITARNS